MIYFTTIFIYHIRSIVIGIFIIGGMISFGVVYTTLSSPYTLQEGIPESGNNVSIADDHIEAVFSWIAAKEKTKITVPAISNSVFFIPSSL